jgi:two-component system alkaline phosphatase synthesis response regulator PhoP
MTMENEATLRKVLLADDEHEILDLLALTLEDDERYEVLLASDGQQALELIQQEHPELVFLDVQMPRRDGISVCEEIRKDPSLSGTKVVMLTALAQEAEIDRALVAGADDYMTKPFSPTALHQKLLEALGIEEAAA